MNRPRKTAEPAPAPPLDPNEQAVDDFLEGAPRADTWRDLRETLAARLADARSDLELLPPDDPRRPEREKRVRELREQVAALAREEAVTQFVEESVRASLSRPRPFGATDDEEDDGGPY
jgi:hypothetical protein